MGLNRLLSLSKNSVLPEHKQPSAKASKIAVKTTSDRENRKEKCKVKESSADISSTKIDKTIKNGKSASTTKKSMLWNTLRMTNKNKGSAKKGNCRHLIGFRDMLIIELECSLDYRVSGDNFHTPGKVHKTPKTLLQHHRPIEDSVESIKS